MKILMLTPYLPYPLLSGGQIRTFNLLKNLKDKHDITLFSLIKDEADKQYISNIEQFCSKVKVFKRSNKPFTLGNVLKSGFSFYPFVVTRNLVTQTLREVEKELKSAPYDLIHAETFYMMPNIPPTKVPTILVEQTIEYLGYESYAKGSRNFLLKPLLYIDIAKIKYWERHYWEHANRLITMSENDKRFIMREDPKVQAVDVVANGVDVAYFDQVRKRLPHDPTILFVGTFAWLPNVQAVTHLVQEVWPLIKAKVSTAKLHIVGFKPTKDVLAFNGLEDVTVDGGVEDIREAYATAHVLVAPVMWGKGTRYKILEAMATNTPIVATPLAVEGIAGIEPNKHVLIGKTSEELANKTVEVLTSIDTQHQLADNSYQLVKSGYNWPTIAHDLDNVYQSLGKKPS